MMREIKGYHVGIQKVATPGMGCRKFFIATIF
jgi:hypothetical protein